MTDLLNRQELLNAWHEVSDLEWDYDSKGSRIEAVRRLMEWNRVHRNLDELCEVEFNR